MSRIIDHFASWMTGGGLFATLAGVPWDNDATVDKIALDIEYFGNHSGLKESSPLVEKMTDWPNDEQLTDVEIGRLQQIIINKYSVSWSKLWDAIHTIYDPLENYNMTEKSTPGVVTTRKENTDINVANTANGNVYGFNSSSAVPASTSGGNSRTTGDKSKNYSEESKTGFDQLERSGNIGVTTSQQMLEQEINIRKHHFFDIVFADVDTILTINYWKGW